MFPSTTAPQRRSTGTRSAPGISAGDVSTSLLNELLRHCTFAQDCRGLHTKPCGSCGTKITRDPSDEMGKQEPTEDGVRLLLNTLKGEIHNIAPVRSNEIFDKGKYESMPTTSRDAERNSRSYVSDTTVISQDIQTALIYKFSGISSQEQASVLASNSNKWNPAGMEYALRAQFPRVHRHHQRSPRPQRRERRTFAGEPKVTSGDSEAENEGFSDEKLNRFLDSKGSVQFQPGE